MNIYLIGMPGCGKSTVGKALSNEIKYEYIDLDAYIEKKNHMSIPDMFSLKGEAYFRECEKNALDDFIDKDRFIISCGGGIIGNISNKELMNGKVIFIDVDINTLKERISNDKINIRPMFKTKTVDELYNERIDKYNLFKDYTVKNINVVDAVKEIKEVLGL